LLYVSKFLWLIYYSSAVSLPSDYKLPFPVHVHTVLFCAIPCTLEDGFRGCGDGPNWSTYSSSLSSSSPSSSFSRFSDVREYAWLGFDEGVAHNDVHLPPCCEDEHSSAQSSQLQLSDRSRLTVSSNYDRSCWLVGHFVGFLISRTCKVVIA